MKRLLFNRFKKNVFARKQMESDSFKPIIHSRNKSRRNNQNATMTKFKPFQSRNRKHQFETQFIRGPKYMRKHVYKKVPIFKRQPEHKRETEHERETEHDTSAEYNEEPEPEYKEAYDYKTTKPKPHFEASEHAAGHAGPEPDRMGWITVDSTHHRLGRMRR